MSHLAGILAGKHFAQKDVPSLVGRKYIVTGGQSLYVPNWPTLPSSYFLEACVQGRTGSACLRLAACTRTAPT
jgi:hypothetical protein